MRGILCRGLRLELVAGLGIALAMPAFAVLPATTTTLTAQSDKTGSCPTTGLSVMLTTLSVAVTGTGSVPAGTVAIVDEAPSTPVQLASATLNSAGQANLVLYLSDGPHSLVAVYAGSATSGGSTSTAVPLTISTQCDTEFVVTTSNFSPSSATGTLTVTAGQAGTGTVTVVPSQQYASSLTAPAFVTISCSGLPDESSCGFTPENVGISAGQGAGVTSSMVIQTYAASTTSISPANLPGKSPTPIAWAFLLPGALGLGGLAWGARRRAWLSRLSLLALLCVITMLGTTGCNPRYAYQHHGPVPNPGTSAGTYTVTVTGQSSNGVTAVRSNTTFVLTVK